MFKCKVGVPVKVKHLVNDEHFDNAILASAPCTFKFKLNVSLGSNVQIPGEVIVLNSIVLPHKELNRSYKNQIIL